MLSTKSVGATIRKGADVTLSVLVIVSLLVVIVAWRTNNLRQAQRAADVSASATRLGNTQPTQLHVSDVSRSPLTVNLRDGTPREVVVLSTSCRACGESRAEWAQLARQVHLMTPVLAISDEPAEDVSRFLGDASITPLSMPRDSIVRKFPSRFIPVTIMTSGGGDVSYVHVGAFRQQDRLALLTVVDSVTGASQNIRAGGTNHSPNR